MKGEQYEWYRFNQEDHLDTPALIIYPDRIKQNIAKLKEMVSCSDMLRPHVKTHKSAEATKLLIMNGIDKFKCATITEAKMLGECGAKDALLAYQPTRQKMERLLQLIRAYPETLYSCLIDNLQSALMIAELAQENKLIIPVYIDLNVGMNRTGIKPGPAYDLFITVLPLTGIKVMGFHAYDGHIREVDLPERVQHCNADFEAVEQLRERINKQGFPYPLLIAGGSPTFQIHSRRKNVECSPGTFIFWDKGYHDTIPDQDFLFAAVLICRIVSMPDASKICIDLGYKSVSSENDLQNRVWFLNAPRLSPCSQSEEHMVIEVGERHRYRIGDLFYVVPIHICPTVALYDQAYVVINHSLSDIWPIDARDR
ncbi:D-TA family PLP-dependent enzyme [Pedobacter heparinus]|uniref:D-TA family PLP-dependent enzyme n=1 Tax=Pedobacter heparinus TaxID=984 RepID=UPI00292D9CBB|nr:D-TA family PLP-dependent enzyme [Pedobacter heparinus]